MKASIRNALLALTTGCFLLSCANANMYARKENRANSPLTNSKSPTISRAMAKNALESGLTLDCASFLFSIPSSNEEKPNEFILDGAKLELALSSLSFHGLSLGLDAPLNYNGVEKDVGLTLHDERLFFSLTDATSDYAANYGGLRFKTSVRSSEDHAGEEDELTRGKTYFEYGSLDYFLYSIFDNFDIAPIRVVENKENKAVEEEETEEENTFSIDWEALLNSFDNGIDKGNGLIQINLPLGDEIVPLGLYANSNNVVNAVEFPLGESAHTFPSGMKVGFKANITADSAEFALPFEEDTYLELEDSLELVNKLGDLAKRKSFGVDASLSIKHIEDAVEGDDTHFERKAISEVGTLTASVDCNLDGGYRDVTASANLSCQGGGNEAISLHIDDDSGSPQCYFDFNGVLRGFSSFSAFTSLFSSISSAMDDESIQNQTILRLVAGLIATSDSLSEAIEAITGSGVYTNINEGHYESILASIEKIGHKNNRIYATLDLSQAKGSGKINIVADASASSLISLEFVDAGIVTTNTPKLSLLLNGSINLRGYVKKSIDKSSYPEYRHLPSLSDSLSAFAESDKLSISVEGYLSKKGTSATTSYSVPSWDGQKTLSTQGFSFAGKLGFDLAAKAGTGSITFEDHKEKYFNDHNLKVDVTGDKVTSDSDSKDYLGTEGADSNFLLVEYDSKNNNSQFANSANTNKGNRANPKNGSLKGRFSIHSLDGVLDIVADLLTSTDPRFKRLTNLFSNVMDKSTLGTILAGHYLEAVSNGFLSATQISSKSATFTFKPGLIKESYPLQLRVSFGDDYTDSEGVLKAGKIRTLEILSSCPSSISDGSDLYAKITFDSVTEMPAFNFNKSSYSSFLPFSSIKHLLQYLLGTITLGTTDESTVTTYCIDLTANLTISLESNMKITMKIFIYLDGTNVRILGQVSYVKIPKLTGLLISGEGTTTIFYETDGENSEGDLYIHRALLSSDMVSTRRVTGKNFMNNLGAWLGYILNFSSTIRNALDGTDSSGGQQAIHGEDLIRSYGIASGSSLSSPSWNITVALSAILPSSVSSVVTFDDLPLTIAGKTVTYSSNGKKYSKQSLYSFSGTQGISFISILSASAVISASISNISSGTYKNAWSNSSYTLTLNKVKSSGWLFKSYSYEKLTSGTPSNLFYGSYGKSNSNSSYKNTSYSVKP